MRRYEIDVDGRWRHKFLSLQMLIFSLVLFTFIYLQLCTIGIWWTPDIRVQYETKCVNICGRYWIYSWSCRNMRNTDNTFIWSFDENPDTTVSDNLIIQFFFIFPRFTFFYFFFCELQTNLVTSPITEQSYNIRPYFFIGSQRIDHNV